MNEAHINTHFQTHLQTIHVLEVNFKSLFLYDTYVSKICVYLTKPCFILQNYQLIFKIQKISFIFTHPQLKTLSQIMIALYRMIK